jgi:hypothetical protein
VAVELALGEPASPILALAARALAVGLVFRAAQVRKGMMISATMFNSLSIGLIAGPAVSL